MMGMMDNKKKSLGAIILAAKPSEEEGPAYSEEAYKTAGEELVAALEQKDPMAIMDALSSAIQLCKDKEEMGESDEEESKEEDSKEVK